MKCEHVAFFNKISIEANEYRIVSLLIEISVLEIFSFTVSLVEVFA